MKSCEHWNSYISRRIDGELPPELDAQLSEHLGECLPCRERLHQEESASATLRRKLAADDESLFDLESRLLSSTQLLLEECTHVESQRTTRIPAGAVAAAASFLVGLSIWFVLFSGSHDSNPDGSASSAPPRDDSNVAFAAPQSVVSLSQENRELKLLDLDPTTPKHETRSPTPQDAQLQMSVPMRIGAQAEMGIEVIRTRSLILEPQAASNPALSEPRWSIELERVETRLVRFEPQPAWH